MPSEAVQQFPAEWSHITELSELCACSIYPPPQQYAQTYRSNHTTCAAIYCSAWLILHGFATSMEKRLHLTDIDWQCLKLKSTSARGFFAIRNSSVFHFDALYNDLGLAKHRLATLAVRLFFWQSSTTPQNQSLIRKREYNPQRLVRWPEALACLWPRCQGQHRKFETNMSEVMTWIWIHFLS